MPVPVSSGSRKNLWIAASDGDLARVRELIERDGMSPNAPDPNTYTPMHAAASYGHIDLLEYLVSKGGDVNIADEDNDTPIYTVESQEVAQWLIEHGAVVDRVNGEGQSPADVLEEDFPEIAAFLRSHSQSSNPNPIAPSSDSVSLALPSEHATDSASERLTSNLLSSIQELAASSSATGEEPSEAEIRAAVEAVVLQGVQVGQEMGRQAQSTSTGVMDQSHGGSGLEREREGDEEAKRRRTD